MSTDNLALRSAKKHVQNFSEESGAMAEHHEAMDSWDCEAYLQLGIDAYTWLSWVATGINSATRSGSIEPRLEFDQAIESLYRGWLIAAQGALEWLKSQEARGYTLANHEQFINCVSQAHSFVSDLDRIREIAAKVPSAADLDLIAIDPPLEWKNEPSWSD